MMKYVHINGFKGIQDVSIELERLTVFVGPNASGKTSVLQAIDLLANTLQMQTSLPEDQKQQYRNSTGMYQKFVRDETSLSCEIDGIVVRPKLLVTSVGFGQGQPGMIAYRGISEESWIYTNTLPAQIKDVGWSRLFNFDAALMAEPSSELGNYLASDGKGLASNLALMALNQPDQFASIQSGLHSIVPSVERIRLDRAVHSGMLKESIIFDLRGGRSIPSYGASEGTLLVLALTTALVSKTRPNLILLDDIDRGLHPLAQRDFVVLLRKVLEQQPELQVVATTHSPYLLDSLSPREVRMTTLDDDGTVACGRLIDHPDFEKWKDEMTPGELWSIFGEKWVGRSPHNAEVPG